MYVPTQDDLQAIRVGVANVIDGRDAGRRESFVTFFIDVPGQRGGHGERSRGNSLFSPMPSSCRSTRAELSQPRPLRERRLKIEISLPVRTPDPTILSRDSDVDHACEHQLSACGTSSVDSRDVHFAIRVAATKMLRRSSIGFVLSVLSSDPGTPSSASWMRIMTCACVSQLMHCSRSKRFGARLPDLPLSRLC